MSAPTSSNSHPTPADVRRVLHYLEFGEGCDCAYCRKLHIWTQAVEQEALATARAESDALRAALETITASLQREYDGVQGGDRPPYYGNGILYALHVIHKYTTALAPSPAEGESR